MYSICQYAFLNGGYSYNKSQAHNYRIDQPGFIQKGSSSFIQAKRQPMGKIDMKHAINYKWGKTAKIATSTHP